MILSASLKPQVIDVGANTGDGSDVQVEDGMLVSKEEHACSGEAKDVEESADVSFHFGWATCGQSLTVPMYRPPCPGLPSMSRRAVNSATLARAPGSPVESLRSLEHLSGAQTRSHSSMRSWSRVLTLCFVKAF